MPWKSLLSVFIYSNIPLEIFLSITPSLYVLLLSNNCVLFNVHRVEWILSPCWPQIHYQKRAYKIYVLFIRLCCACYILGLFVLIE